MGILFWKRMRKDCERHWLASWMCEKFSPSVQKHTKLWESLLSASREKPSFPKETILKMFLANQVNRTSDEVGDVDRSIRRYWIRWNAELISFILCYTLENLRENWFFSLQFDLKLRQTSVKITIAWWQQHLCQKFILRYNRFSKTTSSRVFSSCIHPIAI